MSSLGTGVLVGGDGWGAGEISTLGTGWLVGGTDLSFPVTQNVFMRPFP